MADNKVIESLKTGYSTDVESLKSLQAQGLEAINELDEARKSGDAGRVSDASEKVDKIGADIKSAREAVEAKVEQLGWFTEYQDAEELTKSVKEKNEQNMKNLFAQLSAETAKEGKPLSVGTQFANMLKWRGITRWQDVMDLNADTRLIVPLRKEGLVAATEVKSLEGKTYKDIKSIYSNYGEVFEDGNGDPVPGFVGFQCGLVEDNSISCLLDPPEEDFEECITQRSLNGNRVRFVREASRVNNAASVLETIYNPYPDMEQDGTKPESTFTLEDVTVRDATIANFITASDRVLEDCSFVAQHIDHVLISNVNREKRRQLIEGTGTNGQMLGILNQPGLLSRTHQDTNDGGAATDNIYDTFRRGLTDLWFQAASLDNICVIMNPRDGEIIDLTKDDLGRYLFNDSDCFNRQLRCLKIRYSTDIPEGTAVMGNFSGNWEFWLRKALTIRMGLTGNQFIENARTILAEMRALTLVRCPRKILKVDGLA